MGKGSNYTGSCYCGAVQFTVSEYSALRAGICTAVHHLNQPSGLSLGMVASPQCPLRFAR